MTGLELSRAAIVEHPALPIIAITGYLTKPFSDAELVGGDAATRAPMTAPRSRSARRLQPAFGGCSAGRMVSWLSAATCGLVASGIAVVGCGGEAGEPPIGAAAGRVSGTFASRVVSFTPGDGSGFGQDSLPEVVLGAPRGAPAGTGSLDVLALGVGGEIILGFTGTILDGPGVDFIVFENAFQVSGGAAIFREPAEVAVSDDGEAWTVFPCDPGDLSRTRCAGLTPTLSSPENGVSPVDPTVAGGDGFDLAEIAVASARFVRIRDRAASGAAAAPSAGFDLDAISIVHGSADLP